MTAVYFDATLTDDQRRERLYAGDLFVLSPTPSSLALCAFAREMLEAAFAPHDPERAQFEMPVHDYARLLGELKPKFIHHAESKRLIRQLLKEVGCSEETTYFDVPRLRSSTSDNYLTTGIAYAFHPHRDTWYSAPMCQINWWLPVYPITHDNAMAFHPQYFDAALPNSSARYDYQRWTQTSRFNAVQFVGKDTREQPRAQIPVATKPDIRLLPPVGSIIVFSAAQLHSSVPNSSGRTRFSIDFRTVNVDDVASLRGAPNMDSESTGTALPDFLRVSDLAHLPEELIARYMPGHPTPAGASSERSRPLSETEATDA